MIAPLAVEVGRPVRFEGYAEDYGVPIVTVQFSLDDGENWTDYDAVSYTHLDVYKRQPQYCNRKPAVRSGLFCAQILSRWVERLPEGAPRGW